MQTWKFQKTKQNLKIWCIFNAKYNMDENTLKKLKMLKVFFYDTNIESDIIVN